MPVYLRATYPHINQLGQWRKNLYKLRNLAVLSEQTEKENALTTSPQTSRENRLRIGVASTLLTQSERKS